MFLAATRRRNWSNRKLEWPDESSMPFPSNMSSDRSKGPDPPRRALSWIMFILCLASSNLFFMWSTWARCMFAIGRAALPSSTSGDSLKGLTALTGSRLNFFSTEIDLSGSLVNAGVRRVLRTSGDRRPSALPTCWTGIGIGSRLGLGQDLAGFESPLVWNMGGIFV